jgi:hypothetical protein
MIMNKTLFTALLLVMVAFTLGACVEDEPYGECQFFPSAQKECNVVTNDDGETTQGINCVISEHPQCEVGICIRYEGSDPFCSEPCKKDSECPDGGTCIEFARGCDSDGINCNKYCISDASRGI